MRLGEVDVERQYGGLHRGGSQHIRNKQQIFQTRSQITGKSILGQERRSFIRGPCYTGISNAFTCPTTINKPLIRDYSRPQDFMASTNSSLMPFNKKTSSRLSFTLSSTFSTFSLSILGLQCFTS